MTHDSTMAFARAMTFKGLAPCPQDCRWQIPTDSDICTEVETLALLFGFVRALRPRVVVETGCNVGCAAQVIVSALEANGDRGILFTCDIEPEFRDATYVRTSGVATVFANTGVELVKDYAEQADLFWIDSSDGSRMDELRWIHDHHKKGATVLVHDTNLIAHVTDVVRTFERYVLLPGPRGLGIIQL